MATSPIASGLSPALPKVQSHESSTPPAAQTAVQSEAQTGRQIEQQITESLSAVQQRSLMQRVKDIEKSESADSGSVNNAPAAASDSDKILAAALLEVDENPFDDSLSLEGLEKGLQMLMREPLLTDSGSANNASISANSAKTLEELLKNFDPNEVGDLKYSDDQDVAEVTKILESCAQFFQDLLKQDRKSLAVWVKTQSENRYRNYQRADLPYPIYPFYHSRVCKGQLDAEPTYRNKFNPALVLNFTSAYSECIKRLPPFKLEAYLDEIPPEMRALEEIAMKFTSLAKIIPQNNEELAQWLAQWTETEKPLIANLAMIFENTMPAPTEKIAQCRSAFIHFQNALQQKNLFEQLLIGCMPREIRELMNTPYMQEMRAKFQQELLKALPK